MVITLKARRSPGLKIIIGVTIHTEREVSYRLVIDSDSCDTPGERLAKGLVDSDSWSYNKL